MATVSIVEVGNIVDNYCLMFYFDRLFNGVSPSSIFSYLTKL